MPPIAHQAVREWVEATAAITQPDSIFWCDGSEDEKAFLYAEAVRQGVLIPLNQDKLPGCYYHRSHPNDVARVEHCTFICTELAEDAGPTNHWADPTSMRARLMGLAAGSMKGRTLYVVPYLMGPPGG